MVAGARGAQLRATPVAPNSASLMSGFGSGTVQLGWSDGKDEGGNGIYGIPFNVVSGNQTLLPLTLGAYASSSDPGPVPFYSDMSIENWYSSAGLPPRHPGRSPAIITG